MVETSQEQARNLSENIRTLIATHRQETRNSMLIAVVNDVVLNIADYTVIAKLGGIDIWEFFYEHLLSGVRNIDHRKRMREITDKLRELYRVSIELHKSEQPTQNDLIKVFAYIDNLHFLYGGELDIVGMNYFEKMYTKVVKQGARRVLLNAVNVVLFGPLRIVVTELIDAIPFLPNPPELIYGTVRLSEINTLARIYNNNVDIGDIRIAEVTEMISKNEIVNVLRSRAEHSRLSKLLTYLSHVLENGWVGRLYDFMNKITINLNKGLSRMVMWLTLTS